MTASSDFLVDFPTLWIVPDWIEAHCPMPTASGGLITYSMYDWQLYCTANHYRVKPTAKPGQLAPAFANRRSQVVAPQKTGKGPWSASIICAEATGPVLFDGFASGGESYDCADHGCSCGWGYEYEPSEPMGRPWAQPLIQLTATSQDQTDNVFGPLQKMIRGGPLAERMRVGEEFVRVGADGRIDTVTSSAQSKLGNPVTFVLQDESGLYTKTNKMIKVAETQRRGAAGMGGRTMETTNAWDPSEDSYAQRTAESRVTDVFRFHRIPPANLSYGNKAERRRIHSFAYSGSGHVDLDAIEAEAAELIETDPAQAERFFGNRLVQGSGAWMPAELWERALSQPLKPV